MMPPPLHLSDIHCKYFPYRRCHGKQTPLLKDAINERTNEGIYVGSRKTLYTCLMNKIKNCFKILNIFI